MSDFRFACPHCGQRITGDARYKGTEITCPACQKSLTVPSPPPRASVGAHVDGGKIAPLALISFVCSLGLGLGSIPGIILGHRAQAQLRRNPALRGKRLATAGLVISYAFLLGMTAILTTGLFVLNPKQGRQVTLEEQETTTPEVVAARRVDELKLRDPQSESEHNLKIRFGGGGFFMDRPVRDASNGGFISFTMKVDPVAPMSLYCTYWGNDAGGRRFDIIVNDEVIATQVLDYNDPGRFFDVEYKIPHGITRGQTNVTVVLQAYPRKTVGGIFGCQMLKRGT
jgi:hypothetical protein